MTRLCFDIDFILFAAASVAEQNYIVATHIPTGEKMEFENRTALWGDWRKKNGGWLGQQNKEAGETIYLAEEFVVEECKRPRMLTFDGKVVSPLNGAKRLVDQKIEEICKKLGTNTYYGYTGRGEVFRHDVATLQPYKGQRSEVKPLILEELKDYVIEKHNIQLVTGIEADDAVNMDTHQAYERWKKSKSDDDKLVAVAIDKDNKQTQGFHYNPDKDSAVREINGFGKLWLDKKGEVDGEGRCWLYYQICSKDQADNYAANCMSEVKWGEKSAYEALKDCKNDREAWEAIVRVFKRLYPEPKTIKNFRGDVITIDYLHVMQEMATLAMMLRYANGDKIDVKAVLTKLGIEHD